MAIYKTKVFARWARAEKLPDQSLCDVVQQMRDGLVDADLGGGLFKKRVPRPGKGKSGGYRTLLASNRSTRWVFMYGFPKNARANIDRSEEAALKALAKSFLEMSAANLKRAQAGNELIKVVCDEKEVSNS